MEERDPRYPGLGRAAGLVLMALVAQALAMIFITLVAEWGGGRHELMLLDTAVANIAAFTLVLVWGVERAGAPFHEIVPFPGFHPMLVPFIAFAAVGSAALLSETDNVVRWLAPMPAWAQEMSRGMEKEVSRLTPAMVFTLSIVAPFTEEPFFRGLILRGLMQRYAPWAAVAMTAGLFALAHGNPYQFPSAFLMGVLFGWLFLRTRSIWPCILAHGACNSVTWLSLHVVKARVAGFTDLPQDLTRVTFQPPWFDGLGLLCLAIGLLGIVLFTNDESVQGSGFRVQ